MSSQGRHGVGGDNLSSPRNEGVQERWFIMWRFMAPGLLGLNVLLTLGGWATGQSDLGRHYLPPPPKDYLNKTVTLDITGILSKRYEPILRPRPLKDIEPANIIAPPMRWVWQIAAKGKTYELDFS